jgi:hypothetical protein
MEAHAIKLIEARYRFIPTPCYSSEGLESLDSRVINLFSVLSQEAAQLVKRHDCSRVLLTSTTFPLFVDEAFIRRVRALNLYRDVGLPPPELFITAYECAGWGYMLRYVENSKHGVERIILQIADPNLLSVEQWKWASQWGKSGFGVASLVLEIPEQSSAFRVKESKKDIALAALVREVKEFAAEYLPSAVALPFFPENTRNLVRSGLKGFPLFPDRYDEYGHCFGSDPWISVMRDHEAQNSDRIALVSLALSGYMTFGLLDVRDALWTSESYAQK